MFHPSKRCLRELREFLNEALHHLADLQGQFSSGRDHQGTDLHRVAEIKTSSGQATTLFSLIMLSPDSHLHLLQLLLSLQEQFYDRNDKSQRLSTARHLKNVTVITGQCN